MNDSDVTRSIARFALAGPSRFDDALAAVATPVLLDALAVTVAGRAQPQAQALAASIEGEGSSIDAALLLGFSSHVLDYDDVSMVAVCHPSVPTLSALLAFATSRERRDPITGRDFLAAYAVGTEVLIRVGEALGFAHYRLGFHPTSTIGSISAAAAVSVLAGLDEAQCVTALGMAASLSGGLKKNFGSSVKPLHVGFAASHGLRAVRLAQAGLTASRSPMEQAGFLHAFSGGRVDRWPQAVHLGAPYAMIAPGFELKRYPCCYMVHKIIEAVLALRRTHAGDVTAWVRAVVRLPAGAMQALIHPYPATGLAAKFSAPYAVVAGLLDGRIDLASFEDAAVLRPEIQRRLRDVEVLAADEGGDSGSDIGQAPVEVELHWPDGSLSRRCIVASPGSPQDPMTPAQSLAKWLDCLRVGRPDLDVRTSTSLHDTGREIQNLTDVRPWLAQVLGVTVLPVSPPNP